jgi:nucleoside-diphosphate-sugar epimerase
MAVGYGHDLVKVLVAGAGGFIGGHLVASLLADGIDVRAVDRKPHSEWLQCFADAENVMLDLDSASTSAAAVAGCDRVFNLACDMGGMGFIELNKALCMRSVLTNTHLIAAAADAGVDRYFFASTGPPGVRRVPGRPRGRLRMGEAVQRTDVPTPCGGLRLGCADRPVPQCVRTPLHLGGREGEGPGGHLSKGGPSRPPRP